jgi:hypothetical protein
LVDQRIWFPLEVHGLDGVVDGLVEDVSVCEGLMGEIVGFQVSPDGFDVVEFGRVFGQPLDAQPMGAGVRDQTVEQGIGDLRIGTRTNRRGTLSVPLRLSLFPLPSASQTPELRMRGLILFL